MQLTCKLSKIGAAVAGTVVWILVAHPISVQAQCVMCYLSASASGERASQAIRLGILVLAIPTLLVFAGLFILAYRRRDPVDNEECSVATRLELAEGFPILSTQQHENGRYWGFGRNTKNFQKAAG